MRLIQGLLIGITLTLTYFLGVGPTALLARIRGRLPIPSSRPPASGWRPAPDPHDDPDYRMRQT